MDEIPTYNHSKPEPEDTDKPSFYHKAAKIALYAPLFGGIFLKSLQYSLVGNKETWVQFASFGILGVASLISLGSIVLAIIALFGISTYGTTGILWRSLRGILLSVTLMWILGTSVVGNYLKLRSEQLLEAMNKAGAQAKTTTLREEAEKEKTAKEAADSEQANAAKTKTGQTKSERQLTGDEAVMAKAMSAYMEKLQVFQKSFDSSADVLKTVSVLDMKLVEHKEDLQPRKGAVNHYLEANEKLMGFVNRGETGYRECLVKLSASAGTLDVGLKNYRQTMTDRNFISMKVRMTDQRIGTAMLGMLNVLETSWGNWKYDTEKKKVIFQDTTALENYLTFYKDMNAATSEQAQLRAQLVKLPETASAQ